MNVTTASEVEKESPRKLTAKTVIRELQEWLFTIIFAIIVYSILTLFVGRYEVHSVSMLPNFAPGDRMIVSKLTYLFTEPQRGDVVILNMDKDLRYIKRVIGVPGDQIDIIDNVIYLNGEELDEPYIENHDAVYDDGRYFVPENHIFFMGDNRELSTDSRIIGSVFDSTIVGKVLFIYWPLLNL